jgi:hypothetical protein
VTTSIPNLVGPTDLSGDHPLDAPRRRLDRADEHLENLNMQISGYLNRRGSAYWTIKERDTQPGHYVFRLHVQEGPDSAHWSLIAADCVHNLRASLDNLIWQVGLQRRKPDKLRSLSFPICTSLGAFNRRKRLLEPLLPDGTIDLLDRLQPYHSGDLAGRHRLAILNQLWSSDKHRVPLLICALPHGAASHLDGAGDHTLDIVLGPFDDGAVIAKAVVTGNADPDQNFNAGFGFEVAFDGNPEIRGLPVLDFLSSVQKEIRVKIFPEFTRFF